MGLCFAEFKITLEEGNFPTVDSVSGACEGNQSQ